MASAEPSLASELEWEAPPSCPSAILASAEPSLASELEWEAPPSCPSATNVADRLKQRLASAGLHHAPTLRAHAQVLETPPHYTLHLELDGVSSARRTLTSTDCDELADAAVLFVVLAITPESPESPPSTAIPDPPSPTEPPPPSPEPPPSVANPDPSSPTEPPPSLPPHEPTAPQQRPSTPAQQTPRRDPSVPRRPSPPPAPPTHTPVSIRLRLNGGIHIGSLPATTGQVGLTTSVDGPLWQVELTGAYLLPQTQQSTTNPDIGGRFQAWALEPRACVTPGWTHVTIPLCLGVGIGAIHGSGRGSVDPQTSTSLWISALGAAGVTWRPPRWQRWGLGIRAEARPALTRARFGTVQSGVLFRAPPVAGQFTANIELRLHTFWANRHELRRSRTN